MKNTSLNLILILFFTLTVDNLFSKTDPYTGSFINTSYNVSLQIKPVGNEYHGVLTVMQNYFALKATKENNTLKGTLYGNNGPVAFTAKISEGIITINSMDYTDYFVLVTPDHGLELVDLKPYMQDTASAVPNHNQDANDNYNYSYSQYSQGQASEQMHSGGSNHGGANPSNTYPANNDRDLLQIISGSQIVFYRRTSYVSDNVASSITYVNYCPNGRFNLNYDGSFSVSGDYGGNAQGASRSRNSGNWYLVNYQGNPAVHMIYDNGESSINPVNKQNLMQGRWRIGNTQYAIQRNGAKCR
jgi:hypothetical protein